MKTTTSPVLSYVTQSQEELAVIRAFGRDQVLRAIQETHTRIDVNTRAWVCGTLIANWYELRVQAVGCGLVVLVVVLRSSLTAGLVGIAFSYVLSVDQGLSDVVRLWTRLEVAMVSPERVLEYTSIEAEGAQNRHILDPVDAKWPHKGAITLENVVFNYKPDASPVLKGVSFTAMREDGIVGRTGAGKSSLTMALFRINELVSGRILVDGVDISHTMLETLRSRLSIIPQSPVLFKGPLRLFLNPFEEFEDQSMWCALAKVEMKDKISGLENKLLFELAENGENLSAGGTSVVVYGSCVVVRVSRGSDGRSDGVDR